MNWSAVFWLIITALFGVLAVIRGVSGEFGFAAGNAVQGVGTAIMAYNYV